MRYETKTDEAIDGRQAELEIRLCCARWIKSTGKMGGKWRQLQQRDKTLVEQGLEGERRGKRI